MVRYAPWEIGLQQDALDDRRQELAGIIDRLPEIRRRLWSSSRHENEFGVAVGRYRFVEALRASSLNNPPDLGSHESRRFERYQRNARTLVDEPVRALIETARQRCAELDRRGRLVNPADRADLNRARDLFGEKFELERDLRESRQHYAQQVIDDLRGRINVANQHGRFAATGGQSLEVLHAQVRNPEAKLDPPTQEIEMGQEGALAEHYQEAGCEEFASLMACAGHRDLYDPATGTGDVITRKDFSDVTSAPGAPAAARDHVVVYFGPPTSPEGVVCEAWTDQPRALGALDYSVREAHAYDNDYQKWAHGRDYLATARAQYLDHAWIANHPRADITASPNTATATLDAIEDHADAHAVYQIGHPYHGVADPALGRPLNQDTLLATGAQGFAVYPENWSPTPLTPSSDQAEALGPYLPAGAASLSFGDRMLPTAHGSGSEGESPTAEPAAPGHFAYDQFGYGHPAWSASVEGQFSDLSVSDSPSPPGQTDPGPSVTQQAGSSHSWTPSQTLAYLAQVNAARAGQDHAEQGYPAQEYPGQGYPAGSNPQQPARRGGRGR
ncbi:hypothetical protein [Micromonospora profundi]|uniref:hypothetical protein n=1 Tax=Micromonospora TaxID=1873 RepID=UPI0033B712E5